MPRKPFLSLALFWCLVPYALTHHWLVMLLMGLLFIALTRSGYAIVILAALMALDFHGLAVAAFLYTAWRGRVSPLELVAVSLLAGGLSGPTVAAEACLAGFLSAVLGGLVRPVQLPPLPRLDSSLLLIALLGLGVLSVCGLGFRVVVGECLALAGEPVPGRLCYATVVPPGGEESRTGYWIDVRYEYQGLQGTRFQPGQSCLTQEEAEQWVKAHPPGSEVTVYQVAGCSVLSREFSQTDGAMLVFSLIFGWGPLLWFIGTRLA